MKYMTDSKKAKIWIWQNNHGYWLFTEIDYQSECIKMTEQEAKEWAEKFKIRIRKSNKLYEPTT